MDQIVADEADAPLVLKIATPSVPRGRESTGGPVANPLKARTYINYDALPRDLQERVRTAIEALGWA